MKVKLLNANLKVLVSQGSSNIYIKQYKVIYIFIFT